MFSREENGLCILTLQKHSVSFTLSKNWANNNAEVQRTELEKKKSLKPLDLSFSSTLGWRPCIESVAKIASKIIGACIRSMDYYTPVIYSFIYIRPPLEPEWNIVVLYGEEFQNVI